MTSASDRQPESSGKFHQGHELEMYPINTGRGEVYRMLCPYEIFILIHFHFDSFSF
jgi:hypothetical protein